MSIYIRLVNVSISENLSIQESGNIVAVNGGREIIDNNIDLNRNCILVSL